MQGVYALSSINYFSETSIERIRTIDLRHIPLGSIEKTFKVYILSLHFIFCLHYSIQSNLNGSNTDGSFTMANSNSFLSPNEILPIAQENKYLGKFSYFIVKLYVVCTH